MATIKFKLDKRAKQPSYRLIARVMAGKHRFEYYPFEERLTEQQWDQNAQRMKGHNMTAIHFNSQIAQLQAKVSMTYLQLKETSRGGVVNFNDFKHVIKTGSLPEKTEEKITEPDQEETLVDLIRDFVNKGNHSKGTVRIYNTAISNLEEFHNQTQVPIGVKTFTLPAYMEFVNWMVKSGRYVNESINNYLKKIDAAIRWHIKFNSESTGGMLPDAICDRLFTIISRVHKLPTKKKQQPEFKEGEVSLLWSLNLSAETRLEKARDLAIFACWTGLRVSDLLGDPVNHRPPLKKNNVLLKDQLLRYHAGKTKEVEATEVPLRDEVISLVLKYHDHHPVFLMPVISAQKANKYLTEIMETLARFAQYAYRNPRASWDTVLRYEEFDRLNQWFGGLTKDNWHSWAMKCDSFLAELTVADMVGHRVVTQIKPRWEELTFHSCRRFFITFLLDNGATIDDAAKMAAHSDTRTTKLYDRSSNRIAAHRVKSILRK